MLHSIAGFTICFHGGPHSYSESGPALHLYQAFPHHNDQGTLFTKHRQHGATTQAVANNLLTTLYSGEKPHRNFELTLQSIVSKGGWTESLAG
jgi:hypothetical protein